uniref:Expressed protein n=5 Tax=Oryza TaxID=4527 RepID=Q10DD2_ORYSJ|nr:expressed protein [Oryza sativa Japonica Group]
MGLERTWCLEIAQPEESDHHIKLDISIYTKACMKDNYSTEKQCEKEEEEEQKQGLFGCVHVRISVLLMRDFSLIGVSPAVKRQQDENTHIQDAELLVTCTFEKYQYSDLEIA